MIRSAGLDDFDAIAGLYAQLNRDDPPVSGAAFARVFEEILGREGLDLLVLDLDGSIVGTTYLNVMPNLSRGGRPTKSSRTSSSPNTDVERGWAVASWTPHSTGRGWRVATRRCCRQGHETRTPTPSTERVDSQTMPRRPTLLDPETRPWRQ